MRHLIVAVLLALALGAIAVEAVGAALTQAWPALPTHVAAGVVALLAGYAAAVTVLFRALLRAIGHSAEWVTNEIEQATSRILHENEPSPLAGRGRVHAGTVVSATPPPAPSRTAGATLEDGVIAGLRAE
ncbi:MAG TPA: hypothetical protein VGR57_19225 [Ktedonobacterales bacterium]|nr:hypothetical protein [Ktedonobacterales bacterium]